LSIEENFECAGSSNGRAKMASVGFIREIEGERPLCVA